MPTDVSTPIWVCDICRSRFDADREAAERCEAAGPPATVPDGSLLLDYRDRYGSVGPSGFVLLPLFRVPGRIGTVASRYSSTIGHTVRYWIGVDPADHTDGDGRLRGPHPEPRWVGSDKLWPHRAGVVNQISGTSIGGRSPAAGSAVAAWVLDAAGLACEDAPLDAEPDASFVRALTPEVAAVLDALDARPERTKTDPEGRYRWMWGGPLGALATEACTRPGSGTTNLERARWWLASVPAAPLVEAANARWDQWRSGADITAPVPRLRCRQLTSASKLSRTLRELVAATGVPWPPRTSSDGYVSILVRECLEYELDTTTRLFEVPTVVAVGGAKGGVGKSTVAAAFASRLAREGKRVVLVDCDLTGPSQHLIFELGPALCDVDTRRLKASPTVVEGLSALSPGQLFEAGRTSWTAETTSSWLSFVGSSLDLDDVDVVVLDLPPGRGPVHDVVFDPQRVTLAAEVHVTTAHPLAIADTERGLARRSHHHGNGRRILVENLSRAVGRDSGGRLVEIRLAGDEAAATDLAQREGLDWGGSMPWSPDVAELAATTEIGELVLAVMTAPVPTGS